MENIHEIFKILYINSNSINTSLRTRTSFLEKDGMNADEGIVVYSFYYPYYKNNAGQREGSYAIAEWTNNTEPSINESVGKNNYLKTEKSLFRYAVMKLKAGKYFLKDFYIISGDWRFYNKKPYNEKSSPIHFAVRAGEVVYLGNFQYFPYVRIKDKYKIKDYFNEAKAILLKHYPTYAPKLKPLQNN